MHAISQLSKNMAMLIYMQMTQHYTLLPEQKDVRLQCIQINFLIFGKNHAQLQQSLMLKASTEQYRIIIIVSFSP